MQLSASSRSKKTPDKGRGRGVKGGLGAASGIGGGRLHSEVKPTQNSSE